MKQLSIHEKISYSVPISEKKKGETEIRRNPQTKDGDLIAIYDKDIKTLQDVWLCSLKNNAKRPFLGQRDKITNKYNLRTYEEVDKICKEIGSGIINLNLAETLSDYKNYKLQMVGIYSKNREEWIMTDIGCGIMQGMTIVPLYDTFGPESLLYCLNHSRMSILFAQSSCLDTILSQKEIGNLKTVICFDEITQSQQEKAKILNLKLNTFDQIREAGRKNIRPLAKITPETIYTFSYTSGTTGDPKAAMITHKNFVSLIAVIHESKDVKYSNEDVHLSYLPLPHLFDRALCNIMLTYGGAIKFYSGDLLKLKQDLADVRPTFFASVPRLFNKFYDAIISGIQSANFIKKFLGNCAINTKLQNLRKDNDLHHMIWDSLVFKKIRQGLFGGRVRFLVSGSAPISKEVMDFFKIACSAPFCEGYGQTESSAASFLTQFADPINGHVGGPQINVEFKLQDIPEMDYLTTDKNKEGILTPRGEICLRGPAIFAGYYKDEAKTAEAIDSDGWLHTGDVGCINTKNGCLTIIDRKKNIFKLSQGEYIAPEKIESYYLKCTGVAEVFVYGDSIQSHLVSIVVPDKPYIENLGKKLKLTGTFEELCKNIEIRKQICQDMNAEGKKNRLCGFEQVKNVILDPVSMQIQGCLTNTMKLQRHFAKKIFQKQIEEMYKEGCII